MGVIFNLNIVLSTEIVQENEGKYKDMGWINGLNTDAHDKSSFSFMVLMSYLPTHNANQYS